MTDKQIIKALECCHNGGKCDDCPCERTGDCNFEYEVLDLINRQKAKIERLADSNGRLRESVGLMLNYPDGIERIKAEAIKEFAERLKSYAHEISCNVLLVVTKDDIDTLVKEMVGEG
jgi:urease gamma subunit